MALRILTNTQSIFAQNNLSSAQKTLSKTLERLSSGLKINHAQDDVAGRLMAAQMTFQIIGENAGTNNLSMAVDLLNTADSYTATISQNLGRMNELATQANNSLLSTQQRQALQPEFNELTNEIQRLATTASYNGKTLLDGNLQGVTVQGGASVADNVTLNIGNLSTGAGGLNIAGLNIGTLAGATNAISQINTAATTVLAPIVASIGAQAAGLMKSTEAQQAYTTNLLAARSRIQDADLASEVTNLTNSQIISRTGVAALSQANSAQTLALGIFK